MVRMSASACPADARASLPGEVIDSLCVSRTAADRRVASLGSVLVRGFPPSQRVGVGSSRAGSATRSGSRVTIASWGQRAPVSMGMIVVTVALSVGPVVSPSVSSTLLGLTAYHAVDLGEGRVWRLVLSAFAAQNGAQLVWTVLMLMTVFVGVERVVGSVGVLLISLGAHVISTLVIDGLAYSWAWHSWLSRTDFGTSCLIMGTGMALLLATRSKLLASALIIIVIGDGFLNSLMTVLEHLVALFVGAAIFLLVTRAHLHPDGDRTQTQRQAGLRLHV
jgi:hypothetical protein